MSSPIIAFRANAVSSGEAAIAYLQNHDVDLLVLDMIMDPGIDGLDTYQAICVSRPGQKAIIAIPVPPVPLRPVVCGCPGTPAETP